MYAAHQVIIKYKVLLSFEKKQSPFIKQRRRMILTSPAATLIICGVKLAPEAQATKSPAHHQRSCLRNEMTQNC